MFFLPFTLIVCAWLLTFLFKSGAFRYNINQVGFHVQWVNARKALWYKMTAGAVAVLLGLTLVAGCAMHPELASAIVPMALTVAIALFDLYSPLDENLEYDEELLTLPVIGFNLAFTDSSKIMELFQDAVLSAKTVSTVTGEPDYTHLKALTGLKDGGIGKLLNKVQSIPKKPASFLCGSINDAKSPSVGGGMPGSPDNL